MLCMTSPWSCITWCLKLRCVKRMEPKSHSAAPVPRSKVLLSRRLAVAPTTGQAQVQYKTWTHLRRLFPLPLQNFCVILNQHNPSRDKAVHFLVTLKRPDQRNLELQRRVRINKLKPCTAFTGWHAMVAGGLRVSGAFNVKRGLERYSAALDQS